MLQTLLNALFNGWESLHSSQYNWYKSSSLHTTTPRIYSRSGVMTLFQLRTSVICRRRSQGNAVSQLYLSFEFSLYHHLNIQLLTGLCWENKFSKLVRYGFSILIEVLISTSIKDFVYRLVLHQTIYFKLSAFHRFCA